MGPSPEMYNVEPPRRPRSRQVPEYVSSTKLCWDTSTLILSKETQLAPSIRNTFLIIIIIIIINFLRKVLKVKISSPLYH